MKNYWMKLLVGVTAWATFAGRGFQAERIARRFAFVIRFLPDNARDFINLCEFR
jgi:hypothetical protein